MDEKSAEGQVHQPPYKPLPLAKREAMAKHCLDGHNSSKESLAKGIIAGDRMFDRDGWPTSYWYLLATEQPRAPDGRRGKWVTKGDYSQWMWVWQDHGPARPILTSRGII